MIKKLLFIVLMLCCCRIVFGQTLGELTRQDRINVLQSKDDTSKIRALNKLGNTHIYLFIQYKRAENIDSTFLAYNTAMKLADGLQTPDKAYWHMVVLSGMGESQCYVGDTVNGRKKLLTAGAFFKQHQYPNEEINNWRILSKTAEYYSKPKERLVYLKVLASLAEKYKRTAMVIRTKERMIEVIAAMSKTDTIRQLYLEFIRNYKHTNAPDLDNAYVALAHYYRYKGNLPDALFYALAAKDWMVKTNDTTNKKKSEFYGELAEIYQLLGQSINSIEWFKKAIVARRKENIAQVSIYRTAGFVVQEYIKLNKTREGLAYILALAHEFPPIGIDNDGTLWQIKAYCYEALGQFGRAETAYLNMMKAYTSVKVEGEIFHLAQYDIGRFYINRKQFDKAALYINKKDLPDWSATEVKDYHYLLFKLDSANGKYVSAIQHLNSYKNISDSIFNSTKSKQISELEIKYATAQRENDIRTLVQARLLQDTRIKQTERTRNWVITGLVILLFILVLLYNSLRINQKKTREIDLKNISLSKLVTEKEDLLLEKEWLMKEIHHRVKNNLQIVMGLLQRQSSFVDNKQALAAIRNSEQRMQSIALIHQKLYQSANFMLVSMGPYIDEMINYLRDCFDLGDRIVFEQSIAELDFEVNMAVSMGLILNEAITNSIKHAFPADQCGTIGVILEKSGKNSYLLEIADNGVGLDTAFDLKQINSMGFNLMRGLSKQLGGKLNVTNANGLVIKIIFQTG